jgi:ATP-dependent DNA helicase RecG
VNGNGQRVFRGMSKRAREALARSEGLDVEFKEAVSGLTPDDLVAFANSQSGGVVLLGIREGQGRTPSCGTVVGCAVDDRAKQAILSRAEGCSPPVEAEVYVENVAHNPFLRVEVPSGTQKPYCTSGGTYKIRGDGRNKALPPGLLLAMFMEEESNRFLVRFQDAAAALETKVEDLKGDLLYELSSIDRATEQLRENVDGNLTDIGSFAEHAQYESEIASSLAEQIQRSVEGISEDVNAYGRDIEAKLDSLLIHQGIPDPTLDRDDGLVALRTWSLLKRGQTLDAAIEWLAKQHPAATPGQLERIRSTVEDMQADLLGSVERLAKREKTSRSGKVRTTEGSEP